MAEIDLAYGGVITECLRKGTWYKDESREETFRLQIPSHIITHDFKYGFPAITLKELAWNSVVTELIWFLRGDNNIKYLVDHKNPIWNKDAYNWYKKICKKNRLYEVTFRDFVKAIKAGETMESLSSVHGGVPGDGDNYKLGDVGQNYSKQWRSYANQVDQIVSLIRSMRSNIMSTRLKVEAWNPAETDKTALPPCHTGFQIIGVPLSEEMPVELAGYSDGEWLNIIDQGLEFEALGHMPSHGFELHWNQRSVDTYLGLPFNIASYATLAKLLQELTGYKALKIQGDLKCVHLYDNSIEEARSLLNLELDKGDCDIQIDLPEGFKEMGFDELMSKITPDCFKLVDYESYPPLRVPMKAPKEV